MPGRHGDQPIRKASTPRIIAGLVMLILAVAIATTPFILMAHDMTAQSGITSTHDDAASALDRKQKAKELAAARDYNQRLFDSGQNVMGDAVDPFASADKTRTFTTYAQQDKDYQSQLDNPSDGIMASVRYPRLGIDLPIRHTTSTDVLATGAGHMYGTSLPVGGANTHAVISAHTGMGDKILFDKLSLRQGRIGDFFYITVLGRDMAYEVTDITVVEPDDFSKLTIVPGEDLVTLLTCTPYGANTQRILVTGKRTSMPEPAPLLRDAPKDPTVYWMIAGVAAAWLLVTAFIVWYLRRRGTIASRAIHWRA